MSFNLPDIKVEVKENKAEITLPIELPPPAQEPIKKKIMELTKVKEIEFKKPETKKPEPKKPSNESEKVLEKPKDSQREAPKQPENKPESTSPRQ